MTEVDAERAMLEAFELLLDPKRPESCPISTQVLGYGEISAVLQIGEGELGEFAYKRMPMFQSTAEVEAYLRQYEAYLDILDGKIGIRVPEDRVVHFADHRGEWFTVYVIQKKLQPFAIGSSLLHQLADNEIERLFAAVLGEIKRVFAYNYQQGDGREIGFDGQISNWAVRNMEQPNSLPEDIELIYFDTNTPLMRIQGVEQLNTDLFLRSAPSFLRGVVKMLFLEDVTTRYYDLRRVLIDLLANLFKERRADLVPRLLERTNRELEMMPGFRAISQDEVASYYRQDAFIWRLYLALRKLDRFLCEQRGRPYPFVLPESVQR